MTLLARPTPFLRRDDTEIIGNEDWSAVRQDVDFVEGAWKKVKMLEVDDTQAS
jgi:hypothetical protein